MAEEFTREQELLKKLRDERCGRNAAELARRLGKDATYVNRLLYPIGKKGRKGIGLEIMRKATEAFQLPPGYWEGADRDVGAPAAEGAPPDAEQYRQLLLDLEDIPPSRRSALLDHIHQLAQEAREAVAHHQKREREKTAAARVPPSSRTVANVRYGDGNRRQKSLPLRTVHDPFTAEPDERESALYKRIERVPKEPHGQSRGKSSRKVARVEKK